MEEKTDQIQITILLKRWCDGDNSAMEELMPLVYPNLHGIAKNYMRKERANHTLSPSALLNEAYMQLVNERNRTLNNRLHFFAVASRAMSHILINYAAARNTQKRGGGKMERFDIDLDVLGKYPEQLLIDLSVVLLDLEKKDPESAHLVMMRYYGGMTIEEIADVLNVGASTVKRNLRFGLAWIARHLKPKERVNHKV